MEGFMWGSLRTMRSMGSGRRLGWMMKANHMLGVMSMGKCTGKGNWCLIRDNVLMKVFYHLFVAFIMKGVYIKVIVNIE